MASASGPAYEPAEHVLRQPHLSLRIGIGHAFAHFQPQAQGVRNAPGLKQPGYQRAKHGVGRPGFEFRQAVETFHERGVHAQIPLPARPPFGRLRPRQEFPHVRRRLHPALPQGAQQFAGRPRLQPAMQTLPRPQRQRRPHRVVAPPRHLPRELRPERPLRARPNEFVHIEAVNALGFDDGSSRRVQRHRFLQGFEDPFLVPTEPFTLPRLATREGAVEDFLALRLGVIRGAQGDRCRLQFRRGNLAPHGCINAGPRRDDDAFARTFPHPGEQPRQLLQPPIGIGADPVRPPRIVHHEQDLAVLVPAILDPGRVVGHADDLGGVVALPQESDEFLGDGRLAGARRPVEQQCPPSARDAGTSGRSCGGRTIGTLSGWSPPCARTMARRSASVNVLSARPSSRLRMASTNARRHAVRSCRGTWP